MLELPHQITAQGAAVGDHDRSGEPMHDPFIVDSAPPGEPSSLSTRLRLLLVAAVVAALALVGVGAYAIANLPVPRGADPAERLPDSAIFYLDVNLYPGDSTEAKVLRALNSLGLVDSSADPQGDIAALLTTLGVENVQAADVIRWIGSRAAVAVYDPSGSADDDVTVAFATASRNDRAARETLADIWDATGGQ